MKRIIKSISVLILCSTLVFTSVNSIYYNTFTLEVQAAEVVVTAEVSAAVIEYLWGLLLTMGLVGQLDSWSARSSAIEAVLDNISAYPELSDDMTFVVSVGEEETTVTLEQVSEIIKHTVNGTAAENLKGEIFKVLNGGGGKNGGDKDREVRIVGGLMTVMLMRIGNFIQGPLEDYIHSLGFEKSLAQSAAEQIESLATDLELAAPAYAQENAVRCITEINGELFYINNYHMDFIDKYNISFDYSGEFYHNVSVGFREGDGDMHYTQIYQKYENPVNEPCIVCLIPQVIWNPQNYMRVVVVKFDLIEKSWKLCGSSWGNTSTHKGFSSGVRMYSTATFRNELETVSVADYNNIASSFVPFYANYGTFYISSSYNDHSFQGNSAAANIYYKNIGTSKGFSDIEVYCSGTDSDNYHVMPVLYCPTLVDLQNDCNMLANTPLADWDYSIFANSNERTEPLTVGSAYSKVGQDSLKELADAMLNGGMSTDEVIDAAQAVDTLREVEIPILPELYPELYPEYQPDVNPADYPDVYPDYDPVSNPNPAPSIQPNPDKVIESVTKPEPDQKPNPNPDDDNDDWDTIDLTERFPFCIPFDLIHAFKLLVADAEAPYWEFPIHYEFLGHVIDYTFVIDMSQFEILAKVFRTCETIGFCVGLVLITRGIIRG